MKGLIYTALLMLSMISIKSCSCEEMILDVENFETLFGCNNTKYSLKLDIRNDYILIRNKSDFDEIVSGDCHPDIDFDIYDLVIGRQSSGSINDTIIYNLMQTCPGKDVLLTIGVYHGMGAMPSNVTYHALIPKLRSIKDLEVIIDTDYEF